MRAKNLISIILIILFSSCIDRFNYQVDLPEGLPIAVFGHISNQPGPYQVEINTSFDVNSKENIKTPVSVKQLLIMDDSGISEKLTEIKPGIYQTSPTGLQGRISGVYKLRIELHDGKIYESIPDTLLPPGRIDSVYPEFYTRTDALGATRHGFDLMINSSSNSKTARYMWNFEGTFKSLTHPEAIDPAKSQCYPLPNIPCNFLPPCTGLRNIAPNLLTPVFERVAECTCCTCWYKIYNRSPVLSDELHSVETYRAIKVYDIPLNEWIFQDKIYSFVTQKSMTIQSFAYFKSIKAQKEAVGSLSQPSVGRIPNTFVQINGEPTPINGIFYSTGSDSKSIFITPLDVPKGIVVPLVPYDTDVASINCLELFPNATITRPDFWIN